MLAPHICSICFVFSLFLYILYQKLREKSSFCLEICGKTSILLRFFHADYHAPCPEVVAFAATHMLLLLLLLLLLPITLSSPCLMPRSLCSLEPCSLVAACCLFCCCYRLETAAAIGISCCLFGERICSLVVW